MASSEEDIVKEIAVIDDQAAAPKPKWLTRSMAEEFSRRHVLITTFKEALVFLLFAVCVNLATIGRREISMFYLTRALTNQLIEREFNGSDGFFLSFDNLATYSDFWVYCNTRLLDSLYWETYHKPDTEDFKILNIEDSKIKPSDMDDRKILFENKILGVPRLKQVRVRNNSCKIHKNVAAKFTKCYATYSEAAEDRTPFGYANTEAWIYNPEHKTRSLYRKGKAAVYGAGGYYQDLGHTRKEAVKVLQHLEWGLWLTRGTRAVTIDFTVYNANLNLCCIVWYDLLIEFIPSGGVKTAHSMQSFQLVSYVKNIDYLLTFAEFLVYILAVFYLIEELREMFYFKFRYLLQFWSYIDCSIIGLTIAFFILYWLSPSLTDAIKKIQAKPTEYGNMEYIGYARNTMNNIAGCLLFFTYIKCFKYLNFNKTMGQLNNTLKRCSWDIASFALMFFIIFYAFGQLGHMLFGGIVHDFSTLFISMFTLLRTILGDFDYQAIEKANKYLAPVYFLSYIFLVFFVLMNMFLAIINDTYADVKTEIAIAPDEMQMTEFIKTEVYMLLAKMGFKFTFEDVQKSGINATINQIRGALKKCGFTDMEIEMFFARYNIDPLAEIGSYDMKTLLKELEAHTTAPESTDTSLVQVNDFIAQQDRLVMIEQAVVKLSTQVDVLIKKLEELDSQRKTKTAPK